jgi:NADH:ubiquinone oxidoreductase subunit 3 (subunit A)
MILILILFFVSLLLKKRTLNYEKLSTYECGFVNFTDARGVFDVNFYIIAILFLIFDVEIIIFIPLILLPFNLYSFLIFYILLFILFLGFILEWKKLKTQVF